MVKETLELYQPMSLLP